MRITESLEIENARRGYQELRSDYEAEGIKKHGLTRSDCIYIRQTTPPPTPHPGLCRRRSRFHGYVNWCSDIYQLSSCRGINV